MRQRQQGRRRRGRGRLGARRQLREALRGPALRSVAPQLKQVGDEPGVGLTASAPGVCAE
eukprot:scaffold278706_cov51-Prasinocladus_malaysianus.AAC.1